MPPVDAPPLIEARGVVAGHDSPVVGPLDLTLHPGEVVGLGGPNGAGKSTFLHALAGNGTVFEGTVRRAPGLQLAIQPQRPERPAELPLTGRELLAVMGIHTPPESLVPLLEQRIDTLSGGQYQLLIIQACLGGDAPLVLLDEPTNNLDPATVAGLAALIDAAAEAGRGVLVISHERPFLERVCHRRVEVAPWT